MEIGKIRNVSEAEDLEEFWRQKIKVTVETTFNLLATYNITHIPVSVYSKLDKVLYYNSETKGNKQLYGYGSILLDIDCELGYR